jgi:DNA ligase-1
VFQQLKAVAIASGPGAQRQKLSGVAGLLRRATPAEARYLVRTVTGKLRLRIGDATILDALAEVYGEGRRHPSALERAPNICSDLGLVAAAVARSGLVALARMGVRPGHPVRPNARTATL